MTRASSGLVVTSLEPWDDVWRRNQYLVAGLLRADPSLRVLFVEPPQDVGHAALHRRLVRRGRGLRHAPAVEGVLHDQLWLFEPTKVLPRRLHPGYDRAGARAVQRAAAAAGVPEPVLWVNDPSTAALARLHDGPALYDITDDWTRAPRPPRAQERLRRDEAVLLDRCEVVTVCSTNLVDTRSTVRPVQLITNGVDVARYRRPEPRPHDVPDGPLAVYVGTLHTDRLDVDLCCSTAAALAASPERAHLVLVGPDALEASDRERLLDAGVVLLGARPFDAVPAYLQHAHALVVPHVISPFTDSLDPLKLYEYLAVGRPVVSTAVAGFRDATARTVTVRGAQEFPSAVRRATALWQETEQPPSELPTWDRQTALMGEALAAARRSAAARR